MTINAGIWIDHHKAVIVLLTDDGQEMLQICSDQRATMRFSGGFTSEELVHAKRLHRGRQA